MSENRKIKLMIEIDEETYNKYLHWQKDGGHTQEAEEIIANGVVLAENDWIPASERTPETDDYVLVYDSCDMFVAWYDLRGGWHSSDDKLDKNTPIRYWRPLPKAPESEDK